MWAASTCRQKPTTLPVLAKEPRRIQLDILRNLSADQLIDALTDGIKENSSAEELAAVKPQVDQMVATMKS